MTHIVRFLLANLSVAALFFGALHVVNGGWDLYCVLFVGMDVGEVIGFDERALEPQQSVVIF
jgi:hypothetical protein